MTEENGSLGIEAELSRYRADVLYLEKHRQELLARYPEHWVAIYHQQVVGVAKDPRRLLNQLKRKGIPPSQVHREWLSTREDLLIVQTEGHPQVLRPVL